MTNCQYENREGMLDKHAFEYQYNAKSIYYAKAKNTS